MSTNRRDFRNRIAEDPKVQQLLQNVCEKYGEDYTANDVEGLLKEYCEKMHWDVRRIGTGNNLNYLISSKNSPEDKAFIQFISLSPAALDAEKLLRSKGDQIPWLPGISYYHFAKSKIVDGDQMRAAVMEFFPHSLMGMVSDFRKNKTESVERIDKAVLIGKEIGEFLESLKKEKLIWLDLKIENILLRSDGKIAVSDIKTIVNPDKLEVRNGKVQFEGVTKEFLSDVFQNQRMNETPPEFVKEVVEREYSNQLAIILHYMMTAPESIQDSLPTIVDNMTKFNFSHPVFAADKGLRMKTIIEGLSHHNPAKRFRYQDALRLLKVVDDKAAFDKQLVFAKENSKKGSSLKETIPKDHAQLLMDGLLKLEQAKREYRKHKTREEMQRLDAEAKAKAGQGLIRTSLGAVSSLYRNKSASKLSSPQTSPQTSPQASPRLPRSPRLIRVHHESSGKKSRSPSPKDDRKKPK